MALAQLSTLIPYNSGDTHPLPCSGARLERIQARGRELCLRRGRHHRRQGRRPTVGRAHPADRRRARHPVPAASRLESRERRAGR